MKMLLCLTIVTMLVLSALPAAQSRPEEEDGNDSVKEKLIGAWRLAWMEEPAPDGRLARVTNRNGILVYTPDGHMSVQIMFPKSESSLSNDYVQNGYEASYGSYDLNERAHTVTHHVQGSITAGLVGKDLTRMYQFSGGRLIIRSTRPDERWSVAWERY